jgi:WD40 repeat protein
VAAFSPDGARVVTASADGTARIFPGSIEEWIRTGCNLLAQPADPRAVPDRCPAGVVIR